MEHWRVKLVDTPYADKMEHSKSFRTIEEALEYFYILSDNEEPIDICQLPPEESGYLTDEEAIDECTFPSVLPVDVCGKIEISTNIDNDEISHENMFDPEEPSTTKGMSNLKRKLNSTESNIELRWRKKINMYQKHMSKNADHRSTLHPYKNHKVIWDHPIYAVGKTQVMEDRRAIFSRLSFP
ncbi:uncharacterized protein TNCV_891831 [Trichonephila clavipes]|nr:uncharacterized protein TNCV_891831 [Trichonephila clavipes]